MSAVDGGRSRGRHVLPALAAVVVAAVVAVAVLLGSGTPGGTGQAGGAPAPGAPAAQPARSAPEQPAPEQPASAPSETTQQAPGTAAGPARAPEPLRVLLPTLGVSSTLDPLPLLGDGTLQAPTVWDVAGWYADGPRPGEVGPAVVAGHVDGPDGPAVFWDLEDLRPGDRVEVERSDGSTVAFAVTRSLVVRKDGFPTAEVYGPTPDAELRLITCDGEFDDATGHYVDNLVVFATELPA